VGSEPKGSTPARSAEERRAKRAGPQGEGAARVALLSPVPDIRTNLQQNPLFGAFLLSSAPSNRFDGAFSE